MDLFRTESILLKSHWVLVVMDQFSRRIIGFAVQPRDIDGHSLCGMFNQIIAGTGLPRRLSFDNAPLFDFAQWKTNLRILEIDPIRSVPNVPVSHPFIERLIGACVESFSIICSTGILRISFASSIHSRPTTTASESTKASKAISRITKRATKSLRR